MLTFQERFALKLARVFWGKFWKFRKQYKAPTNSIRKLTICVDNAVVLTLLDAATKVTQEEMTKNVSNIEKYQSLSLLHDKFVL